MATREKIRRQLYSVWDLLDKDVKKELDLYIPTTIYLQDPLVAANDPQYGFSELEVRWEPGLRDGPTSARFAVVDYNADTGALAPPAHWDSDKRKFTYKGSSLNGDRAHEFQFHQVNVWAHLQDALIFFEEGAGMGRRIPWGFDGNRLIVVPHAGYGQNAYYDRQSKSLQFYYYEHEGEKVFTCLSADIIHHEFGHAVLDGVRPFLQETVSTETAAFHEFVGDISAILLLMRNNDFRRKLAKANSGGLAGAMTLESIAEQFGKTVEGREYLRSATNKETMATVQGDPSAHFVSQVLTGAMYDMLLAFAKNYQDRGESAGDAFWHAINRMQRVVFQPLDLLPPADVTFRDYAFAVLRNEELSNPTDPDDYQTLMREIFLRRGILQLEDIGELIKPRRLYDHFKVDVFHRIESITQSRASAYRFLDDNRRVLCIPSNQDFIVADLYEVNKYSEVAHRLPRQYVLVYLWREEVELRGSQYGRLDGQLVAMLCGGTLVFDERGNNLSRFQKHGSHLDPSPRNQDAAKIAAAQGQARLAQFKADIAHNVQLGLLGIGQLGAPGLVSSRIAPFVTRNVNGATCFELSAHLSLSEESRIGERSWQISS